MHTFHVHGVKLISREQLNGEPWPANVVPLTPGEVDSVSITFTQNQRCGYSTAMSLLMPTPV